MFHFKCALMGFGLLPVSGLCLSWTDGGGCVCGAGRGLVRAFTRANLKGENSPVSASDSERPR